MPPKARQVVHEKSFDDALYRLRPQQQQRCDEFVFGITEVLARDATRGRRIGDTNVWVLSTPDLPEFLALVVYYTFDNDRVWLLDVDTP